MKIKCTTLFDITKTNVTNRRQLLETQNYPDKQRNQQRNLETILQIIGLRAQPEDISDPCMNTIKIYWDSEYKDTDQRVWTFIFDVDKESVFSANSNNLGNLYIDCEGVPMIVGLDESADLQDTLSINNIHFEVLS